MLVEFKVEAIKNFDISGLLLALNNIQCKMSIDCKNNIVAVENVEDNLITQVVDLVAKHYNIVGVKIDNLKKYDSISNNNMITFSDDSDLMTQLNSQIKWALEEKKAEEKHVVNIIRSTISKFHLAFSNKKLIDVKIGDIVECDFGYNLPGEIGGNRTHAIVCNRINEMVFLVPISPKPVTFFTGYTCLKASPQTDLIYDKFASTGGTVVISQNGLFRIERVNAVLGKVSNGFMKRLFAAIAEAYNFNKNKQLS